MFGQARTNEERLLAEIANKIKTTNHELCCLTGIAGGIAVVPVYEYSDIQSSLITSDSGNDLYYKVSGTNFTIAFKSPVNISNLCGDNSPVEDTIINVLYEDTLGNKQYTPGPNTINFAAMLSKVFVAKVTIFYNSGFICSFILNMTTSGAGVPSVIDIIPNTSNSNTSTQYLWVNVLAYQKPIQDLLEVWQNGVFVEYITVEDHSRYVPRQCLSYDPVQPFKTFDEEPLVPLYNTPQVVLVTNSVVTIPANTAHYISYLVTQVRTSITINGASVTVPVNAYNTFTSTTLINFDVTFTCGVGETVILTIMKP